MHDVREVCAKLAQMAAYSSTFEMVVPSGVLSVGLQSPMVDSALASRYTSYRATCPRSWTSEPSNIEQALAPMHFAELSISSRHMDARFDASYSECHATPTSNVTDCSL